METNEAVKESNAGLMGWISLVLALMILSYVLFSNSAENLVFTMGFLLLVGLGFVIPRRALKSH